MSGEAGPGDDPGPHAAQGPPPAHNRPLWLDITLLLVAGAIFLSLIGLGNWQMRRLDWKLGLIEAVETRAFGDAVAPPAGPVSESEHAYLRVVIEGRMRHDLRRKVKAITALGPGHWLMTPLIADEGLIWINRGFVPVASGPEDWTAPAGPVRVEGLLRITEPGGTLLERNAPETGRWVSRDVAALSVDAGLAAAGDAAGFFIDADHAGAPGNWPRGGLTVVSFRNNHLSYALTWYAMAALFLGGMAYVVRDRLRRHAPPRHGDSAAQEAARHRAARGVLTGR
ncbi:MAG: SURF1 family protein [Pseudomonadota bacterium]